jgi:hypothetical protein
VALQVRDQDALGLVQAPVLHQHDAVDARAARRDGVDRAQPRRRVQDFGVEPVVQRVEDHPVEPVGTAPLRLEVGRQHVGPPLVARDEDLAAVRVERADHPAPVR